MSDKPETTDPMLEPARALCTLITPNPSDDAVEMLAAALRAAEEAGHARGVRDQELASRGNR